MELKDKTVIELKALAYDILAQMERLQADLGKVNQLIQQKSIQPIQQKSIQPIITKDVSTSKK